MIEKSKVKQLLFFIAILLTNIIICTDYVIYPISYALYEAFPDQTGGVNFIISGPAVIIIFASLLVPVLLKYLSKKKLLVIGSIAFALTSIGGLLIESIPYIIVCRSVGGFCYAIANVTAMGIIADYFVDENKRASFMGIFNAAMSGIGAVMGIVAGALASSGWKNAYKTYWIAVPMILMILFFVPDMKDSGETEKDAAQSERKKSFDMGGSRFWIMMFNYIWLGMAYSIAILYFVSVYVIENGLGNEAVAGGVSSIASISSAAFCLLFGFVYGKLKVRSSIPFYVGLTAALFLMYLAPNKIVLYIAAIIGGGSFGSMFSYVYAEGSTCVPPERVDQALGIITALCGAAMFISTYFETWLMGLLHTELVTPTFLILAIICLIVTVLEIISALAESRKNNTKE